MKTEEVIFDDCEHHSAPVLSTFLVTVHLLGVFDMYRSVCFPGWCKDTRHFIQQVLTLQIIV